MSTDKPPHPGRLRERIAALAERGAISFSTHAFDVRSRQRAIDINDARMVLGHGMIDGPIVAGKNPGEWNCKMIRKAERSARWIGVVTVIVKDERLFVLTVEWEDR